MGHYDTTKVYAEISPLPDHVLVIDMEKGSKVSKGGIIIMDDNGKEHGIRPRWAKVYKVGSRVDFVKPGEWVLMEHGRWTYGVESIIQDENGNEVTLYVQRIDTNAILLVADEKPND